MVVIDSDELPGHEILSQQAKETILCAKRKLKQGRRIINHLMPLSATRLIKTFEQDFLRKFEKPALMNIFFVHIFF